MSHVFPCARSTSPGGSVLFPCARSASPMAVPAFPGSPGLVPRTRTATVIASPHISPCVLLVGSRSNTPMREESRSSSPHRRGSSLSVMPQQKDKESPMSSPQTPQRRGPPPAVLPQQEENESGRFISSRSTLPPNWQMPSKVDMRQSSEKNASSDTQPPHVNSYLQSKLCENRDRSRIRQSDESKVVQLDKKLDDLQERFDFLSTKVNRVCDDAMAVRTRRQLEERLTSRLDELQSKLQNQADDLSKKLQDLCVRFDTSIPELDSKLLLFEQHAASVEMCKELEMRLTTRIHEFQSESHQADESPKKLQDLCVVFDTSIRELDSKLLLFEQHAASVEMCNELEMRLTTKMNEFQSESYELFNALGEAARKNEGRCSKYQGGDGGYSTGASTWHIDSVMTDVCDRVVERLNADLFVRQAVENHQDLQENPTKLQIALEKASHNYATGKQQGRNAQNHPEKDTLADFMWATKVKLSEMRQQSTQDCTNQHLCLQNLEFNVNALGGMLDSMPSPQSSARFGSDETTDPTEISEDEEKRVGQVGVPEDCLAHANRHGSATGLVELARILR